MNKKCSNCEHYKLNENNKTFHCILTHMDYNVKDDIGCTEYKKKE